MSVTDVVAQLRRAHALLTEARRAAAQAEAAITDGATVFATATTGSTQPEVSQINRLAARSGQDVRAARDLFTQTQDLINGYCHEIAGHGIGSEPAPLVALTATDTVSGPTPATTLARHTDQHPDPAIRYAEQIAELRRNGTKVSPERIVFMQRLRTGRIVWLEHGGRWAGLAHILAGTKREEFESCGTAGERVPDLISAALDRGRLVGYIGEDRPVYEVEIDGDTRRVAITVSDNGYIVGAHPMSLDKVLRPHKERNER
ncbi:hypothetical protein [Actinoalloteichus hymeniacidonis]|uniref:Uncharacterized protein n=1 Tax=Actinoalloteichus hymeniacidonis TaxID=340345 RepID=A0AAC9HTE6_9PSEU|nr:hypothetical protein [Actinoalloteichus hymeniacidonis]AOS65272.1 hypothetical protein TL08_22450 [Actinoalloteichus hymeniacidonis]MBB5906646.1 hypothetical protein [Actinoalloteichus hymeniacidonis]